MRLPLCHTIVWAPRPSRCLCEYVRLESHVRATRPAQCRSPALSALYARALTIRRGAKTARKPRTQVSRWNQRVRREIASLRGAFNPRLWFWTRCTALLPSFALSSVRAACYRLGGCQIAPEVSIQGPLLLLGRGSRCSRLHVGEGSNIGPLVTIGLDATVTIGRNVNIAPGAALHTATHPLGFGSRRMRPDVIARSIVIGDGAWIGAGSLILPGVTVGSGSVVSAGAVVGQDVPPNTLVSGNPATVIVHLPFGDR
jgi:acetyltransferase-like isoleucine patch superfamily enzyme